MPWDVTFNTAYNTVELLLNGTVTPKDLEQSAAVACALAGEKGVMHFLVDLCQVTEFTSMAQLYELPAKRYTQMGVDRLARAAVVPAEDEETRKAAQFYEDTCRNRGWNVRLFMERQKALEWLSGTGETAAGRRPQAA